MNIQELQQRLEEEGCNPGAYAIGSRGSASDAFCLTHDGARWQVCYTERGVDQEPFFTSESESQACDYFFDFMMSLRHDHCVGFFHSLVNARALEERLNGLGVASSIDWIPYNGWDDPRYRVFVTGKAIFVARQALGDLPVRDREG